MKTIISDFGLIKIGQNAKENWKIIDDCEPDDIWFHLQKIPSCHLICELKRDLTKDEIYYLATLCKNNTNKCKNFKNVKVDYTFIKNVKKDKTKVGSVFIKNLNTIKL